MWVCTRKYRQELAQNGILMIPQKNLSDDFHNCRRQSLQPDNLQIVTIFFWEKESNIGAKVNSGRRNQLPPVETWQHEGERILPTMKTYRPCLRTTGSNFICASSFITQNE